MTGLFKCLLISCAVSAISGFTGVRDDVSWFKNGERIKNRFVTGVVNGIVDFDCNDTVQGTNVEGECLSKLECTKSGGKIGGLCSLLGSCCVIEKTCGETTSAKLSYFVPPKKFAPDCLLTVKTYSPDVCQIRLDFIEFDIAKPTAKEIKSDSGVTGHTSYDCNTDTFKVEKTSKKLGFTHLCGKNKGQHIYIPVEENQQEIGLRFNFKNLTSNYADFSKPNWRIRIRQLECRKTGYDQLNAPSKLMAMHNILKNKKKSKSDWDLIAPANCLQYYPEKSGVFESFNYDDGRGHYIGRLNYAICFRKSPDVCGARYSAAGKFQMNYNKYDGESPKEEDKCHPTKPESPTVSQDYIRVPGGINSNSVSRDFYCNADLNEDAITARPFEPLFVGVHTDRYSRGVTKEDKPQQYEDDDQADFEEIGFRINYELLAGDCDAPF